MPNLIHSNQLLYPLSGSFSGSLQGTASFAVSASWAPVPVIDTGSLLPTSSFNAWTGSTTSQFAGTSSYAISASNSATASFALTASYYGGSVVSASYATTSSYAIFAETASYATQASNILLEVINQSGAQINKGIVVRITGSNNSSDTPRIGVADWTNDFYSANTLGLAMTNISNGDTGFVMTEGLFKGYDTSTPGWITGQVVYLGPNGSITGSAPQAPLHGVRLGQVTRVQSQNGAIYVRIDNGYELDELHDVLITNATTGDLLTRSGSVWINSKTLSGSYTLSGSLTTNDGVQVQTLTASFISASGGITGSLLGTASYAVSALSSSYASKAGTTDTITVNSFGSPVDSYLLMSNVIALPEVAIGGDTDLRYNASTNTLTAVNISATSITGSLLGTATTASYVVNAVSASFASTASFVRTAQTASYVLNAVSASFASTVPSTGIIGDLSRIATGSVTASVTPSQFSIVSGSSTEFTVTGTGMTVGSAITDSHQVTGSLRLTGSLNISGSTTFNASIIASGAIARGTYFNQILTAAANNDVLINTDINSTFTNGAFTGVANWDLRTSRWANFGTTNNTGIVIGNPIWSGGVPANGYQMFASSGTGAVHYIGSGGGFTIKFRTSANTDASNRLVIGDNNIQITGSLNVGTALNTNVATTNVQIGTSVDAGFKLDVNGTTRTTGNTLLGTTVLSRVGVGTTLPTASLHVLGTISGSGPVTGNEVLRGTWLQPTLHPSSSVGTIYGLEVNPTFDRVFPGDALGTYTQYGTRIFVSASQTGSSDTVGMLTLEGTITDNMPSSNTSTRILNLTPTITKISGSSATSQTIINSSIYSAPTIQTGSGAGAAVDGYWRDIVSAPTLRGFRNLQELICYAAYPINNVVLNQNGMWGFYYSASNGGTNNNIAYENVNGNNALNTTAGSTYIGYPSRTAATFKFDVSGSTRITGNTFLATNTGGRVMIGSSSLDTTQTVGLDYRGIYSGSTGGTVKGVLINPTLYVTGSNPTIIGVDVNPTISKGTVSYGGTVNYYITRVTNAGTYSVTSQNEVFTGLNVSPSVNYNDTSTQGKIRGVELSPTITITQGAGPLNTRDNIASIYCAPTLITSSGAGTNDVANYSVFTLAPSLRGFRNIGSGGELINFNLVPSIGGTSTINTKGYYYSASFVNNTPTNHSAFENFNGNNFLNTNSGNTGIGYTYGTSIPAKLAVSGSALVTDNLTVTGSIQLSGSVTMPARSAFRVYGASLTGITAGVTISGSAVTVDYNQGNNYDNTTGVYTAPVAGLYHVYLNCRTQSGPTQQVIVYKNSTTSSLMWETTGSNSGHFGVSSILSLAVNDTLRAIVAVGTIQFDNNDNWGVAYIG